MRTGAGYLPGPTFEGKREHKMTGHTQEWVRNEALYLENDGPWGEVCSECGIEYQTSAASIFCDDCYKAVLRNTAEENTMLRANRRRRR